MDALTVWVPPGDETAPELLAARGHEFDSTPMLMAAEISGNRSRASLELDLEPKPS